MIGSESFFGYQMAEIRKGGGRVLLRKCLRSLQYLFSFALAIPAVLLVRAISPLVLVRFGVLKSMRIGHFARNTDMYLSERYANKQERRTLDLFYYGRPVSNGQLLKMWRRVLHVTSFAYFADKVNRLFPGYEAHLIVLPTTQRIHCLLDQSKVYLSFTEEEEDFGARELERIGVEKGAAFVCFNARDSAYLEKMFPGKDYRYHDWRDSSIRNYLPAVEELARRGYFALRMGAAVREPLNASRPRIIDYATKHRSEFLDIYLSAKCRFFISTGTGIDQVAMVFRRPIAFVNWPLLEYVHTCSPSDLVIPKLLWKKDERRFLSFPEIISTGVGRLNGRRLAENGIEAVENTPQEIMSVVLEMENRLQGKWVRSEEDEELQSRFRGIFESTRYHGKVVCGMGAEFLRANRGLL